MCNFLFYLKNYIQCINFFDERKLNFMDDLPFKEPNIPSGNKETKNSFVDKIKNYPFVKKIFDKYNSLNAEAQAGVKYGGIFALLIVCFFLFYFSGSDEKIENNATTQEVQIKIEQNATASVSSNTTTNINEQQNMWQKRIMNLFYDKSRIGFNLNNSFPVLIANNFQQEINNQNRISGQNAKVKKIVFVEPKDKSHFLDILVEIVSDDKNQFVVEQYFALNDYIKFKFYDDSIIKKEFGNDDIILVVGDNIFPYMKILNIGSLGNNRVFADIEIKQSSFGGKDFIYHYETEMN